MSATPSQDLLEQIRVDKRDCLTTVPSPFRAQATVVWDALEGLCLARMRRFHEAIPLLRSGVDQVLDLTPARIVYIYHLAQSYERVGELSEAHRYYELASAASPGTRLASDAESRHLALGPAGERSGFRGMLPEAPEAFEPPAITPPVTDAPAAHEDVVDATIDEAPPTAGFPASSTSDRDANCHIDPVDPPDRGGEDPGDLGGPSPADPSTRAASSVKKKRET